MTRTPAATALLAIALAMAGGGSPALADPPSTTLPAIPDNYRQQLDRDRDGFLKARVADLYKYNPTGIVTQADVDQVRRFEQARQRANLLVRSLAFDLDGDGKITRKEFDETPATANQLGKPQLDLAFSQSDADGDGALSYRELALQADAEIESQAARGRKGQDDNPLMFDLNGDGQVNVSELTAAVDAIASVKFQVAKASPGATKTGAAVCALPAASNKAEILIVSTYEGAGLSTVAVNGVDQETTVATLNIQPGKEPLYIVAIGFDPMVWRVEGATDRVERFMVQPRSATAGPGAGVVGLKASKVGFVQANGCGAYSTNAKDASALLLKSAISAALQRDVSHFVAAPKIGSMQIPSGEVDSTRPAQGKPVQIATSVGSFLLDDGVPYAEGNTKANRPALDLQRYYPDGLVQVDADKVVASSPVTPYEVMPQQAGLTQLILTGHLTLSTDGYYIIEKTFPYFPAGLNGGHSVKFLLRKGVELPGGSPGHSSVVSEETRGCLSRTCR